MKGKFIAVSLILAILILPHAVANKSIELIRITHFSGGKHFLDPIGSGGWIDDSWIYGIWEYSSVYWSWWWRVDGIVHYLIYAYNYKTNETRLYRFPLWDGALGNYTRYDAVYQFPGTNILTFIDRDNFNNTIAVFKNNKLEPLFNIDLKEIADNITRSFSENWIYLSIGASFYSGFIDNNYTYLLIAGEYMGYYIEGDGQKTVITKIPTKITNATNVNALKINVPIRIINEYTANYGSAINYIASSQDKIYVVSLSDTILVLTKDLQPLRHISYSYDTDMSRLKCSIYPHKSGFYLICFDTSREEHFIAHSDTTEETPDLDLYITKFDANANPIWSRAYDISSNFGILQGSLVEYNNTLYIGLILESVALDIVPTIITVNSQNGDIINYFNILPHGFGTTHTSVIYPYITSNTIAFMYTDVGAPNEFEYYSILGTILIPTDAPRNYHIQSFFPMTIKEIDTNISISNIDLPEYETITLNVYPPDPIEFEEVTPALLQFYSFAMDRISLFTLRKQTDYTLLLLPILVLAVVLAYISTRRNPMKQTYNY